MEPGRVAEQIRRFGNRTCRGQSPLYEALCERIVDDSALLAIADAAPEGQLVGNVLFAAVHYLLLGGAEHELTQYYASCVADPKPPQAAFPVFREFCIAHASAIRELLTRRRVQTNEVRRCAYLFAAFAHAARVATPRPLALIEVGTSAGLNLLWDRYAYDYGDGRVAGCSDSPVRVRTEVKPGRSIPLPDEPIVVSQRVGVDLHVVDVRDRDELLWLESLVWPEHHDRRALLKAAVRELQRERPRLLEGNILDLLPALVTEAPRTAQVCLFHCHTLHQFTDAERAEFKTILGALSRSRPILELSAEWIGSVTPELHLVRWDQGQSASLHLANVDQHARWIEWLVE
jgi:hypothetical protein